MRTRTNPPFAAGFRRRACVVAASLGLGVAAWADPNPYYVGASVGYNHDSNVFRVPQAASDSYTSVGLLAGLDQPIGRQRLYANGTVRENRFNKLKDLDNTSYSLTGGLDWSSIEKLSGTLKASASQNLASYSSTINTLPVQVRNIEKSSELLARVQYGMASLLTLEGSLTRRELQYSAAEYQRYGYELNVASAGVKYRPSSALTTGLAVRMSRGKYPHEPAPDGQPAKLERNDVDLTANWVPTGQSTIDARLSYGRRTGNAISQDDFTGSTGSVSWQYQPTGKLSFKTSFTRDTGLETNYLNTALGQSIGIGDNNRLTNALAVTANYDATAKIRATANAGYKRRSLTFNSLLEAGGVAGSDSTKTFSLGASYAPTRNSLLSCSVGRESRSADSELSYAYSANTAGCSAQITLQ